MQLNLQVDTALKVADATALIERLVTQSSTLIGALCAMLTRPSTAQTFYA
jgi:hypothetical protein